MHVIQIAKLKSRALMPIWNGLNKSFNINILSQITSDDVLVAILCYMHTQLLRRTQVCKINPLSNILICVHQMQARAMCAMQKSYACNTN